VGRYVGFADGDRISRMVEYDASVAFGGPPLARWEGMSASPTGHRANVGEGPFGDGGGVRSAPQEVC
jgi:hypothetical protein